MPRRSKAHSAKSVEAIASAVYSPFAARLLAGEGPVFAMHVGDTWMEPFPGARMETLRSADHPGMHRYCVTHGLPELREAIQGKLRAQGRACEPDALLVTAGATSGLACTINALLDPGEELLLLAPYWPLAYGMTHAARAHPVELPFFDRVQTPEQALAALEAARTGRTAAVYFSNPSNPTGRVLGPAMLEAISAFARRHDLWIFSDEVYEDYVYQGELTSCVHLAPERTVCLFSFSKAYGMAGNRVGYLVAPVPVCEAVHKVSVHSAYHAPTASQLSALRALSGAAHWCAEARKQYAETGAAVAEILGVPAPEGGCFLFVDCSRALAERGMHGFLEDLAEDGVLVAPGAGAGASYADWVRLCFTAIPPEDAREAARRIRRRLDP